LQEKIECKTDGKYLFSCEDCAIRKHIIDEKHTESEWKTTPASCVSNGLYYTDCIKCGEILQSEVIESSGHEIKTVSAKAPTCTEIGWNAYEYCEKCNYSTYEEIEAKGHTESEWIVDRELTCEQDGLSHTECVECFITLQTKEEQSKGHDYIYIKTVQIDWQNQADGYDLYVCQNDSEHTQKRNIVAWQTRSVTISVDGGLVNGQTSITVEKGTSVTIEAIEDEGKFVSWTVDEKVVSEEQSYTFIAEEDLTFVAKIKRRPLISCKKTGEDLFAMISSLTIMLFALKKLLVKH
jgi:hypothetical protein